MNYRKIYKDLVESRKDRKRIKGIYYENHHIIPKSFGGSNSKDNIVTLTTKEHYIAHLLLVAIYPHSPAMIKALWAMCNLIKVNNNTRIKPCSKMYSFIRDEYIKSVSGENNPFYGKTTSKENIEKFTLRIRKMYAEKGSPTKGRVMEEWQRKLLSDFRKGKLLSDETKDKISKALRGGNHYKAKKIICTKTGKIYGSSIELSEEIGIPTYTIRARLNGRVLCPIDFHYKRL